MLEHHEQTIINVQDALNGNTATVPMSNQAVYVDQVTGERTVITTSNLHRSLDGRITSPQETETCRDCGRGPYARSAIAYCNDCQWVLCRQCTKDDERPLCKRCRRRRFWRWLF